MSGFKRGKEYDQEVKEGVITYPMTVHILETFFRIISKHRLSLGNKIAESILMEEVAAKPEQCLNLKSEWGGSKLPGKDRCGTQSGILRGRDAESVGTTREEG